MRIPRRLWISPKIACRLGLNEFNGSAQPSAKSEEWRVYRSAQPSAKSAAYARNACEHIAAPEPVLSPEGEIGRLKARIEPTGRNRATKSPY